MDKISRIYFNACKDLGLDPVIIKNIEGFKLTFGKKDFYFRNALTPFDDIASCSLATNKYITNQIWAENEIPVPKSISVTKKEYKQGKLDLSEINFPVVLKPTWYTSRGNGVICDIKTKEILLGMLDKFYKKFSCATIEEYKGGLRSFRVLVFYDKVIGLAERIPARIIGDGIHTIKELIDLENAKRKALKKASKIALPFGIIKTTSETEIIFEDLKITQGSIPLKEAIIPIRHACNYAVGGTVVVLPLKNICPPNAELACRATKALNLKLAGLDILCEDIRKPIGKTQGYVLEANISPDISIHNVVSKTKDRIRNPACEIMIKKLIRQNWFSYLYSKYFG